jgi:hypothetical protein
MSDRKLGQGSVQLELHGTFRLRLGVSASEQAAQHQLLCQNHRNKPVHRLHFLVEGHQFLVSSRLKDDRVSEDALVRQIYHHQ